MHVRRLHWILRAAENARGDVTPEQITELRQRATNGGHYWVSVCLEAIEEQQREIDQLREQLKDIVAASRLGEGLDGA